MLDLEKLSQNPVTLLKLNYEAEIYSKIPNFIMEKAKATIFSMVDGCDQCDNLNKLSESKDLVFTNFRELKEILLTNLRDKSEEIDFCTILIINDIHTMTLEKLIIINLWKECYKISSKRPYLIITTFSEYTPEFPFQLSKDACQNMSEKKEKIVNYHGTNFSPNSEEIEKSLSETVIKKHQEIKNTDASTWLVFYCGKENLSKNLYKKIGKEANIYTSKSIRSTNRLYPNKKRNIIIITDDFIPATFMDSVDGVFDSMISKAEDNLNYSTKQISEIRASYQKNGFIYRLCTYDYYKELPRVSYRNYENVCLDKYYLEILKSSLDVTNIFGSIVSKTKIVKDLRDLENYGALSGNKVTKLGDFIINLPLRTENSALLYYSHSNKIPIFPTLVSCVISEIKENLLIDQEEEKDIFLSYLKLFNQILEENDDLESIDITAVSTTKGIKPFVFTNILNKIKDSINILRNFFDLKFEIGVYDSDNLVKALTPYYEKSYLSDVYVIVDEKNLLYRNGDLIYKINRCKFKYTKEKVPSRIVCFYKSRTNEEKHSIQRGKNMIYYYMLL